MDTFRTLLARSARTRQWTTFALCVIVCIGCASCGAKHNDTKSSPTGSTAPDPDDMEGGSGIKHGQGAIGTPGGGEPRAGRPTPQTQWIEPDRASPEAIQAAEAQDGRTAVPADQLPASRGGVVPDSRWYGAKSGTPGDDSPVPHSEEGKSVRVWYGTNRARADATDLSKGFSAERDQDGDQLHLGSVICFIPKSRPKGTTGSSWLGRVLKGEDDRIKLDAIFGQTDAEFYAQLTQRIARAPANERNIVVYIHGYKNSFEAAALRAAQLAVDLSVPGLTAFYSWPSKDAVSEYGADEAAVETAEKHLVRFLSGLATRTGATDIHVIAHSMGNRLLLRTVQRLAADSSAMGGAKFGQIFLAAPDVDLATFKDLAAKYPAISRRTTLYISRKDMALEASAWTHSFARAGYAPPVALVAGIDTVEVSQVDVSTLGHGYVAEAEPVLFDMAMLLRGDDPPSKRPRLLLEQAEKAGTYWLLQSSGK